MTYQQAGRIAVLKRLVGWLVFIPALISTLISVINSIYHFSQEGRGVSAVMLDFIRVTVDALRSVSGFLNLFWYNSPVPDITKGATGANVMFFIIFALIFVGVALQASGARISRQVKHVREGVEDQLILEQLKEDGGLSKEQLENKINVPGHSFLRQYFPLYILPLIILFIAYLVLQLLSHLITATAG